MSPAAPAPELLRASLQAVLDRRSEASVVGFRCAGWEGEPEMEVRDRRCLVRWCPSALAVRETLADPPADGELQVILTDRSDDELGLDLLVRLARRRLLEVDRWEALRRAFTATELDPRLGEERWLADALLESLPPGGYPPVAAGTLDLDTAWDAFLEHRLALPGGAADPLELLRWCADAEGPERLRELDDDRASRVVGELGRRGGGATAAITRLARAGHAADAVALGLVCRVLYSEEPEEEVERAAATARLEGLLGGRSPTAAEGRRWAAAAETLAASWRPDAPSRTADRAAYHRALRRGDELIERFRVEPLAYHSGWLTAGYRRRAERFAAALHRALEATPARPDGELETTATAVASHRRSREEGAEEASTATMAARLVRWLAREEAEPATPGSFPGAARRYATELSFADLARGHLFTRDSGAPLAGAVERLLERALAARERFNRRFGELARGWFEADGEAPSVVPMEAVVERRVVPLLAAGPVLLLVLDGMSFAVYHQLLGDLLDRGWEPRAAGDGERDGDGDEPVPVALPPLPGVTRVSRAALFSGRLEPGGQSAERRGFTRHPALAAAVPAERPPVLFHKAELRGDGGGLAAGTRRAVADPRRPVVGVVLNAVDDQLGRGDQLLTRWSVASVRHLGAVLDAAGEAGRAVVLVADHGHLPERSLERLQADGAGERHRPAGDEPAAGEVVVRGRRVVADGGALIVPWSETVRYQPRKAGYHGGVSPQELLAPLAVLVPAGSDLPGWHRPGGSIPLWWEPGVREASEPEPAAPKSGDRRRRRRPPATPPPSAQRSLFADAEAGPEAADGSAGGGADAAADPAADAPTGDRWAPLFASPVWRAQVERAGGRAFARPDRIAAVLELIDRHGGRLSLAAAGRALNLGLPRLRSTVTQIQRLLNVDAYPILDLDEVSGELRLDRALLAEQFELER